LKINGFVASFMIVSAIPAACSSLAGTDALPGGIDRPAIQADVAQARPPAPPLAGPALRLQSSQAGSGVIVTMPDIRCECDASSVTAGHGSATAGLERGRDGNRRVAIVLSDGRAEIAYP